MSQAAQDQRKANTKKKDSGQNPPPSTANKGPDAKIKEVKDITGWPEDDIKRVLEKHNNDTQITIESIIDGIVFYCYTPFIPSILFFFPLQICGDLVVL